ncbi:MAG: MFS transporter [Planctomycetes bacterium]|nr:MFS transporter [Planctomycetota bacterium]MBI3846237.1 MFS transporter [Planctomycetota bacterium]
MIGQVVSVAGSEVQALGASWLAYRLTQSPIMLGLIGFAARIPVLFLAPVAGVVADRANKHRLVILTQTLLMLQATALAWMTMAGHIQAWHLVGFSLAAGAMNAVDIPARQSFLVEMVGKSDLGNAIALNSSAFNLARIGGPAVAGIVIAWAGEGWCFLLNAASFLAVIAGLFLMRIERRAAARAWSSPWSDLRDGLAYVARMAPMRDALLHLGVLSFAGIPFLTFMPIVAAEILGVKAGGLGALVGAAGVGALIGALGLAARVSLHGLGRTLAVASAIFGSALVALAASRSFALSLVVMAFAGWGMMVVMAGTNTLLQALVPDSLRGRVMSIYTVTFLGLAPFGSLLMGWLARHVGVPITFALGGGVCAVASLVFARRLPVLRDEIRTHVVIGESVAPTVV